ncbi:MAG: TetR family transcriptional regulator [Actinomycetales bacterium]|nr:TetR family transcriptional regulator [Actinomycetales bacterium]
MPRDDRDARRRLLDAGLTLLLEQGYHGVGVQSVLDAAGAPKGSFYHHFADKEEFALQVIDAYMAGVHEALDLSLSDAERPPLDRVRGFFEIVVTGYESEGYLGCLLGGLGQELSGESPVFAEKIEWCLGYIAGRLAEVLDIARAEGDLPSETDTAALATLLVNGWEGAALRSRLLRSAVPLQQMLTFAFTAAVTCPPTGAART